MPQMLDMLTFEAIDRVDEAVFIVDQDASFIYANSFALSYLGYTLEELQTLKISDVDANHPDISDIKGKWEELINQNIKRFETVHRCKNGTLVPVEVSPVFVRQNGALFHISFVRDTKERMQSEEIKKSAEIEARKNKVLSETNAKLDATILALEDAYIKLDLATEKSGELNEKLKSEKARYKSLMELASDGIRILDTDGNLVECNDSFAKMLGYECSEMIGMNAVSWNALLPKEEIKSIFDEILKINSSFIVETKYKRKDGSLIDVEINAKAITLEEQRYLYGSVREISERKRAEKALKETEYRLRTIIDMEPECVKMIDANGRLLFMNPAGLAMIDATLGQVQGKEVLGIIAPEYREAFADMCKRTVAGEKVHLIFEIVSLRGKHRWLETASAPMEIDGETVLLGVTRDITERKKAEEELKRLNHELSSRVEQEVAKRLQTEETRQKERELLIQSEKMAQLGNMLGVIIHQWKQPINVIGLIAQDMRESYKRKELSEDELNTAVDAIMDNINFMAVTADDFRDFYKPSKEKRVFTIVQEIRSLKKLLSHLLSVDNIKVSLEGDENIRVEGFASEFKQVVLNIINNAKDASKDKKMKHALINIRVTRQNGNAIVTFTDNAGGIPEELLPERLFEQFASTKGEHGTGIGLSLCKSIIEENMGGKLTAYNIDGGAEFKIVLPVR